MLSFAAICPHPPMIIPTIGRENLDKAQKTIEAMKKLAEKFAQVKPEVVIVISPHGVIFPDAFTLNLVEKYFSDFKAFGDLTTKMEFKSDLQLSHKIKERMESGRLPVPLTTISEPNLDYGASIPLYYLTQEIARNQSTIPFSVIPLSYSLLDYKAHFLFGHKIKKEILLTNKRVAVIASADLSHRLTEEAPAGFNPQGAIFDKTIVDLIRNKNIDGILELDPNLIKEAGECGLRSIIILLGILGGFNYQPEILSYEGPFGVGYLVANMKIT